MSESWQIQSHRGPYEVQIRQSPLTLLNAELPAQSHILIDLKVAKLYAQDLASLLARPSVLLIQATEAAKTLDHFTGYVEHLVSRKVRRGDHLIAIGGGIIQDITCFLAATLLRGLPWQFVPTTLLAQADSCIGSKSSINVGPAKNLLGTFTPPERIHLDPSFLDTLDERDLRSGIGEMLKVHIIDGPASFAALSADYSRLLQDRPTLVRYLRQSLAIKQTFIEKDEFDQGIRNVLNYGHSFGHALESATDFAIPHGIAVTLGMDMANHVAMRLGLSDLACFQSMHPTLAQNYAGFGEIEVPLEAFFSALAKDKKNVGTQLTLILPDRSGKVSRQSVVDDASFRQACVEFLTETRRR